MGRTPPGDGAHDAGDDRRDVGRAEARVHLRGHRREEPVVGHREEDPRLPEEHHEHDRREPGDGADLDGRREPELPGGLDADGDRVGNVELLVGDDARQDERDGDVEHRADAERDEDADGQVPLRVSRLLRGGRDGVEADVREEDHRRPLQHAGRAEAAEGALVGRDEGVPVLGLARSATAKAMKSRTTVTFMNTMIVLKRADSLIPRTSSAVTARTTRTAGRFRYAPVSSKCCCFSLQSTGAPDPRLRQVDPERVVQEGDDVARPADAHRGGGDEVFEDEVPPDDPRDELAHRRVRVRVRAPGDGDHRRHLRVAEAGEGRRDAGDDEGERHRGACVRRRGAPREHEDARSDDRADAEHHEVERGERPLQPVLALARPPAGDRPTSWRRDRA